MFSHIPVHPNVPERNLFAVLPMSIFFYQIYRENYKHLNMLHDESNNILSHISNREKSTYTNFDQQIIHIIYKFRI